MNMYYDSDDSEYFSDDFSDEDEYNGPHRACKFGRRCRNDSRNHLMVFYHPPGTNIEGNRFKYEARQTMLQQGMHMQQQEDQIRQTQEQQEQRLKDAHRQKEEEQRKQETHHKKIEEEKKKLVFDPKEQYLVEELSLDQLDKLAEHYISLLAKIHKRRKELISNKNCCVICLEKEPVVVSIPCGHMLYCSGCCGSAPRNCAVCRREGQLYKVHS